MATIKLFGDRLSHPVRSIILFFRLNKIPFEEHQVTLLKGENVNNPNLPFDKIPTLSFQTGSEQPFIVTESTSILRYCSQKLPQVPDSMYARNNLEDRIRIDEFFDFFHFYMNAPLVRAVRNKLFYKVRLNKDNPDLAIVDSELKELTKATKQFQAYFLAEKSFLGGDQLNVADLIATQTFEQARYAADFKLTPEVQKYLNRARNSLESEGYEDLLTDVKSLPATCKKLGLI